MSAGLSGYCQRRKHPRCDNPACVCRCHTTIGDLLAESLREWSLQAACRHANPALFFPPPSHSTAAAKRICHTCPVEQQCLWTAMLIETYDTGGRYGVFGGLTSEERRTLARSVTVRQIETTLDALLKEAS